MLKKLGKYEITEEIGSGAMGVVYRAEDPLLGRSVALKTTTAEVARNPDLLKRFYREAQAAARLAHPNIVTIYEINEDNGVPFIAMEFLEGQNLQKIISDRKEVPILKKLQIIVDTCKGLEYAHQRGIVHRDVKPGNIVVSSDGQVKIVDFGIARVGVSSMTRTGVVLGTVMYMSPEQVQGHVVDARSDVFSLGVVLYELLTYQTPFPGEDVPSILMKIINEPPEPITTYIPKCPAQLEQIIERSLAKDREERYQSASDMAFDLLRVVDGLRHDTLDVYLQQGQRLLREGDFTLAKESLQKALEIDSTHQVAQSLLAQVRDGIQARQRAQKIQSSLRGAKEALQVEQYEDAIALADEALRLDPKHEEAQKYKQLAVEGRDRAEKIRRHLERGEKLAAEADFQQAKAEFEAVLAIDPDNATAVMTMDWVLKELSEQERLRQVRQHVERAHIHLAEKQFANALELLDRARELDPINVEVEALTRLVRSSADKEERRKLLLKRLADIEESVNHGKLDTALAAVEQAQQEFPDDPQVLRLHSQVMLRSESKKKRSYVDEQLQAARDLVEKGNHSSALAVLERALQSVPGDQRLSSFLKTVQESQEQSALEAQRRDAIRKANEQIRANNCLGAIETLEKSLASAGQSAELIDLLQFARERHAEQQHERRLHEVLSRAQNHLRQEQHEEAVQVLSRAQEELKSKEIDTLLGNARERRDAFERRREEMIADAVRLLGAGDAAKVVALFDAAPKLYFKNESFQRIYSQARQSMERDQFIRTATQQIKKCLEEEDISSAESLLQQALKAYPDDSRLRDLQKHVQEEELRLRRDLWVKLLEEVQVAIGQMDYARARVVLSSVDWESAELPELAAQAKSLFAEAERCEREACAPRLDLSTPTKPLARLASPRTVPSQRTAKKPQVALWAAAAIVVVLLASLAVWHSRGGGRSTPGVVQLTAAPWAEVTGIRTKKGERLNITGQTPLQVTLPPGNYIIELKNGPAIGELEVTAKPGEVSRVSFAFPEVKIDDLVQSLVSQY
jgi:serine/threonine protein kinase